MQPPAIRYKKLTFSTGLTFYPVLKCSSPPMRAPLCLSFYISSPYPQSTTLLGRLSSLFLTPFFPSSRSGPGTNRGGAGRRASCRCRWRSRPGCGLPGGGAGRGRATSPAAQRGPGHPGSGARRAAASRRRNRLGLGASCVAERSGCCSSCESLCSIATSCVVLWNEIL